MPAMNFPGFPNDDFRAPQDDVLPNELSEQADQSWIRSDLIGERVDRRERLVPRGPPARDRAQVPAEERRLLGGEKRQGADKAMFKEPPLIVRILISQHETP